MITINLIGVPPSASCNDTLYLMVSLGPCYAGDKQRLDNFTKIFAEIKIGRCTNIYNIEHCSGGGG